MNRILLFTISLLAMAFTGAAQQRTLNGKVLDATTQQPLSGATISVLASPFTSTLTGEDGNFSIAVNGRTSIMVSYTGYVAKTIEIAENQMQ